MCLSATQHVSLDRGIAEQVLRCTALLPHHKMSVPSLDALLDGAGAVLRGGTHRICCRPEEGV